MNIIFGGPVARTLSRNFNLERLPFIRWGIQNRWRSISRRISWELTTVWDCPLPLCIAQGSWSVSGTTSGAVQRCHRLFAILVFRRLCCSSISCWLVWGVLECRGIWLPAGGWGRIEWGVDISSTLYAGCPLSWCVAIYCQPPGIFVPVFYSSLLPQSTCSTSKNTKPVGLHMLIGPAGWG